MADGMVEATRGWRRHLANLPSYLSGLLLAAVALGPISFVVLGGFRTTGQIASTPISLPDPWISDNYREIATDVRFWRYVGNSVLIAGLGTAVVVTAAAMASFVLARYAFRGRELIYTFFTIGLLFPASVAILPLYVLIRRLGLLDSPLGVALPQAAFALPITVVILRPFMRQVPAELEDAAAIDGCSRFRFFWRILVPLSRPALTTVAILAVITSWNAYLLPLLILGNQDSWTLPMGVAQFRSQYSQDVARILAYTALSMVPTLGFFVFAERKIVGGLAGAVKG